LILSICALQHHRRALGLEHKLVYGATFVRGIFEIHISRFRCDDATRHEFYSPSDYAWNFAIPHELLQCFYFLGTLKKRLKKEMEGLENLTEEWLHAHRTQDFRAGWRYRSAETTSAEERRNKPKSDASPSDEDVGFAGESDVDSDDSSSEI